MKKIFENKKLLIGLIVVGLFIFWYSHKDIVTRPTGSMVEPSSHHQALLLKDGRVFLTSEEIYNPKTGKFTAVDVIDKDLTIGGVKLLPDGKVRLGGGYQSMPNTRGEDTRSYSGIYDPQKNTFSKVDLKHIFDTERDFGTGTLLPNGNILYTGSVYDVNYFCKNSKMPTCTKDVFKAEIYDPKSNKFFLTDNMDSRIVYHDSLLLPNGKVLVIGGRYVQDKPVPDKAIQYAELYNYKINKFEKINNNYNAKFAVKSFLLKNGNVLVMGYLNKDDSKPIAQIYDTNKNLFRPVSSKNIPRSYGNMIEFKDGRVLMLASEENSTIFDPVKEAFELTGKANVFGWFDEPRGAYTTTLLPSGKVLLAGGVIGHGEFARTIDDIEIYDPKTGVFTKKKMRTPRVNHTATLLQDGRVLIAGGEDRHGRVLKSAELYEDK